MKELYIEYAKQKGIRLPMSEKDIKERDIAQQKELAAQQAAQQKAKEREEAISSIPELRKACDANITKLKDDFAFKNKLLVEEVKKSQEAIISQDNKLLTKDKEIETLKNDINDLQSTINRICGSELIDCSYRILPSEPEPCFSGVCEALND